ncbi:MAG: bifunctional phosphoserine phosphatase/homoserine phosphotransferase ThrH [Caldilineaceae bacterium]|nr:bifunctional phosphoserine phosphatase/homoserine phosphotransferase ThrH [Caldilineaceae bacterium]
MGVTQPPLLAIDLEGILLPEIWIAVSERTGIPQLRLTTRDIDNYDQLMQMRLGILHEHKLGLADIQDVIRQMDVLPGAQEFLAWARTYLPVIIITDSYYELVAPFMPKLNYPTIYAHQLEVDAAGMVVNYHLRTTEGKRKALESFRMLGFRTMAVGDSYNDIGMLQAADQGVLFHPSDKVRADYPNFPVALGYSELRQAVERFISGERAPVQAA